MSLPFRRRHNDAEASHDRARALIANGFLEPLEPDDDGWLRDHVAGCADCRDTQAAFSADREVLRSLRDQLPEPPRDLWARTAAAIEHEAGRRPIAGRSGRAGTAVRTTRPSVVPVGVLSGVLVILVVVATSLFPPTTPLPAASLAPGTQVAVTREPEPTPLLVAANDIGWLAEQSDGTFQLVVANVDEVCTTSPDSCAPIDDAATTRITLPSEPESVLLSKARDQLVVVTAQTENGGGDVLVVPVPTASPTGTPTQTPAPASTGSPVPTRVATPPPPPTEAVTPPPSDLPSPSDLATGEPLETPTTTDGPEGSHSILSGVAVVGDMAYSADGQWLALSARPLDGSVGPDLYLWRIGDPAGALAVTSDHRTFFAGWLGNTILASRVVPAVVNEPTTGASPSPDGTPEPTVRPAKTPKPGKTPPGLATPPADPSAGPTGSPDANGAAVEDRPVSFLLDPETLTVIDLAGQDIWRPVVDPEQRTIVYWSGTLIPDASGTGWELGAGRLVLDRWLDPTSESGAAPGPTGGTSQPPTRSGEPTTTASLDPLATPEPTSSPGPAGAAIVLAEGPVSDFDVSFDPTGVHLAVWIRDPVDALIGTLRLLVIDPATGLPDPAIDPLPAAPALRGFSMDDGRLAWVTPPGQDGEASHVHVLAWNGDDFGQVRSVAGDERLIVIR